MKGLIKLMFFMLISFQSLATVIPVNINVTSKSPQNISINIEFTQLSATNKEKIVETIAIPASNYNVSKKDYDAIKLTKTVNIPSEYYVYQVHDAEAQVKDDFITETMHGNYNEPAYFSSTENTKLIQTSDILFSQADNINILSGNRIVEINLNITGCGDEKIKNIRIEHSSNVINRTYSIWDYCAIL